MGADIDLKDNEKTAYHIDFRGREKYRGGGEVG